MWRFYIKKCYDYLQDHRSRKGISLLQLDRNSADKGVSSFSTPPPHFRLNGTNVNCDKYQKIYTPLTDDTDLLVFIAMLVILYCLKRRNCKLNHLLTFSS